MRPRVVALAALVLCACGRPEAAGELPLVRVAIQPFFAYAPFYLAEAEGYFRDAGMRVEFVKVNRTHEALPALLGGDLDVLPGTAASAVLSAMARGAPIRFVADKGMMSNDECSSMTIVVRSDFPLEEAKTRFRRITLSRDAPTQYLVSRALASQGIVLDSIETVLLPDGVDAEALRTGAIDGTAGGEPWQTRLRRQIEIKPWLEIEAYSPDHQFSFVIFGERLLRTDRDLGIRFLAAFRRGVARYLEGATERNLEILTAATGEERSILAEACWPPMRASGRIGLQSVLDYQRWAMEHGYLDQQATAAQLWDSTLVAATDTILARFGERP